jgi:uncharacterized protein
MASVYKIVFAGPVGSGKTRAVKSLSDIEVVSTEADATDDVKGLKQQTTVAMDYGVMNLANGDRVRLYGTPGQERFDFMWDILTKNALGLVLLLDGSAPDPVGDLRAYVAAFRTIIDQTAVVVGITHTELSDRTVRPAVAEAMAALGLPATVMSADARERADMVMLVKALMYSLDPLYEA